MKVNIFKVKKGKESILKDWGAKIHTQESEALASLTEENCNAESMHIFHAGEEVFVVGVMVAEKGKDILPYNKEREINKQHVKILMECLGSEVELEKVYSLEI